MIDLDEKDSAAIAALRNALANPSTILNAWQTKDLFVCVGEDGVRISLGEKSSPNVAVVADRYERAVDRPFPALLRAFLSAHNGLNVQATSDGRITIVEETHFDVTNGFLPAESLESDESSDFEYSGFCFAKVYHQSRVILVDEGEQCGAVVYDDGDSAVVVAPTMADFFLDLVEYGMSLEAAVSAKT